MFKTPCVEIILYPEFSRSNRQANKSSRTMDAGNHRLLQTSSPAYYSFLETTENYTLQIQRKNQVCSRPRVPRPRVPRHRVYVTESTSQSHVTESTSPSPSPHVSVPLLVTALNPSYAVKHGLPTKHGRGIRRLRVRGQSELYASFCRE